jgi:hypothetical protein
MDRIIELKAMVYDMLAQKEYLESQMMKLNQEIARLSMEANKGINE